MAFILLNIDKKPMRLKGVSVLAAIAVHSGVGVVAKGAYKGIRSQAVVHVMGSGGVTFPVAEARMAFEASKPVPLTLESSAAGVADVLNEVFVPRGDTPRLHEGKMNLTPFPSELEGHWIPVKFENSAGETVADGWVIQHNGRLDFRLLTHSLEGEFSFTSVVPPHMPELKFSGESLIHLDASLSEAD